MSLTYLGAIYSESLPGGLVTLEGQSSLSLTSSGFLKSTAKLSGSSDLVLTSSGFLKSTAKLAGSSNLVLTGTADLLVLYPKLETSKLSDYTIYRTLATHKELANENLISQFKNCPNILNFLDLAFQQMDQLSTDTRDLQESIFNVEDSTGANLDLVGKVVGVVRLTAEDDVYYRERIKTQILINNSDGSLRSTLLALIMTYNLPPDSRSSDEIQINSGSHNHPILYVRDFTKVRDNGGTDLIDRLTSAGAQAQVVVNFDTTPLGEFFGLEGSTGLGLSSVDDTASGGELVGNYNRDLNALILQAFGLEGSVDGYGLNIGAFVSGLVTQDTANKDPGLFEGDLTPTTTSTIGVDTFS